LILGFKYDACKEEWDPFGQINHAASIIPQQAAQTLPTCNTMAGTGTVGQLWEEQDIPFTLMIPLAVEMRNVLVQRASE
jgi:hypothetical protein